VLITFSVIRGDVYLTAIRNDCGVDLEIRLVESGRERGFLPKAHRFSGTMS
jgi:hypothetical protein